MKTVELFLRLVTRNNFVCAAEKELLDTENFNPVWVSEEVIYFQLSQ